MKVFVLFTPRYTDYGEEAAKIVGVFSNMNDLNRVKDTLDPEPYNSEWINGLFVKEFILDQP